VAEGLLARSPLIRAVAAVSVGSVDGALLLDLDYSEDSRADMDCNVVMTDSGEFVEVQGTAEGAPVSRQRLNALVDLAAEGIGELLAIQRRVLGL